MITRSVGRSVGHDWAELLEGLMLVSLAVSVSSSSVILSEFTTRNVARARLIAGGPVKLERPARG